MEKPARGQPCIWRCVARSQDHAGNARAHDHHAGRMECAHQSSAPAVLTSLDRVRPRCLHVRCAIASAQERDSIPENVSAITTLFCVALGKRTAKWVAAGQKSRSGASSASETRPVGAEFAARTAVHRAASGQKSAYQVFKRLASERAFAVALVCDELLSSRVRVVPLVKRAPHLRRLSRSSHTLRHSRADRP
jgi:hypothetical protein